MLILEENYRRHLYELFICFKKTKSVWLLFDLKPAV